MTPYQRDTLKLLLSQIQCCLVPFPEGTKVIPNGTYAENGVAYWNEARFYGGNTVGHVTLDPTNKTDPGPQGIAIMKELP